MGAILGAIKLFFLFSFALIIYTCSRSSPEEKYYESKVEHLKLLESKIDEGDFLWVKNSSNEVMRIEEEKFVSKEKYYDLLYAAKKINEKAILVALTSDGDKQDYAFEVISAYAKNDATSSDYSIKSPYDDLNYGVPDEFFNKAIAKGLNGKNALQTYQLFAKKTGLHYDLTSDSFIKDELCRAVSDSSKSFWFSYVEALIDVANFDIGFIRCSEVSYDTEELFISRADYLKRKYFSYVSMLDGDHCPVSLRQLTAIRHNEAQIDLRDRANKAVIKAANDSSSKIELEIRIHENSQNLPDLNHFVLMENLLNKYNKWEAEICSNNLKEGYSLPVNNKK